VNKVPAALRQERVHIEDVIINWELLALSITAKDLPRASRREETRPAW
jgi:hypothetical protein